MDNRSPNELPWTGERLVTHVHDEVKIEHLHRYALAIELSRGKDVLDIASGEGYGSHLISESAKSVIGVDIDAGSIRHAEAKYKKNNLKFIAGSTSNIPVPSQSVDLVVSFETIEHHDKHEEMMQEIKRVLRPDGTLLISSPEKQSSSNNPYPNHFHVKELYLEELRDLIKKYFKQHRMLYQKMMYASLITPEKDHTGFQVYQGNFDHIIPYPCLQEPKYNICIASDLNITYAPVTMFNAWNVLDQLNQKHHEIYNSRTYRLGKMISLPLKKLFLFFTGK